MDSGGVKVLETADDIQDRRQQVLDRYRRFKELSTIRRQKLEDSYRFQFFQRDADELEKWIQEKLQIASDENYKDPTNLQVGELHWGLVKLQPFSQSKRQYCDMAT